VLSRLHHQSNSIKGVGDLAGGLDQELLPIQTKSHKGGAGLEAESLGDCRSRDHIESERRDSLHDDLLAARVHCGVCAKEPGDKSGPLDRVDEHTIVVDVQLSQLPSKSRTQ
jgi:hypothetical protein